MIKFAAFGVGAAALLAAAPASAITHFANFTPSSSQSNISYSGAADGSGTISSTDELVKFSFTNADGSTGTTTFDANMNLSAALNAATVFSGMAFLPVSSGTVSFTTGSAVTWNGHTGTNLLTANFTGGALGGILGGSTATYGTSTPPYTVNFTSDFLDFSGSTARDMALAINAINPSVGFAFGGNRANFGSVSGNFGADVVSGNPQGVVPEPATWALMLGGFGLVGSTLRSQRRRTSVMFG